MIKFEGKYDLVLSLLSDCDFTTDAIRYYRALAYVGTGEILKALKGLEEIDISHTDNHTDNQDKINYWWLRYICCKLLDNNDGAAICLNKFNFPSTLYFQATLEVQLLDRFLFNPTNVSHEIPIFVKPDGEEITLVNMYLGILPIREPSITIETYLQNFERIINEDCTTKQYKEAKFNLYYALQCLNNSNDNNLAPNVQEAVRTLSYMSSAILILIGAGATLTMLDDIDLASHIQTEFRKVESNISKYERIFNTGPEILIENMKQDILLSSTGLRYNRVVACTNSKKEAVDLLNHFMRSPFLHKCVFFCGHGVSGTGDWSFINNENLTFQDFMMIVNCWEPCYVMVNCCDSQQWGKNGKMKC